MYLVLGKESCSRCEMTKRVLDNKKIPYTYERLEDLPPEDKKQYIELARKQGKLSLPLIIKDNKIYDLQEVQ